MESSPESLELQEEQMAPVFPWATGRGACACEEAVSVSACLLRREGVTAAAPGPVRRAAVAFLCTLGSTTAPCVLAWEPADPHS